MDSLFRRQYLVSPRELDIDDDFNYKKIDSWHIYSHKDCSLSVAKRLDRNIILFGNIIDPENFDFSNEDIINYLIQSENLDDFINDLYRMAGGFVLMIKLDKEYLVFNDACGLKTVYYHQAKEGAYLCSQPLLLKKYLGIERSEQGKSFLESNYIKKNKEFWIPAGMSLFKDVYHLLPNHLLSIKRMEQSRFFPNKKLAKLELNDAVEKFSVELQKIIKAINYRYSLALPITAGWDSRIILSACKPYLENIEFFTLKYRNLSLKAMDIKIPSILLNKIDRIHNIINTDYKIDKNFKKLYESNVDIPHFNDWGIIAYGMGKSKLKNRVSLKGSCSEIARCFYYPTGETKEEIDISDILAFTLYDWSEFSFFKKHLSNWLCDIGILKKMGYVAEDFFYWEHRVGSWQAQSQLEWDIVQETISPFNNRKLLDIALAIPPKFRSSPNYTFFAKVIDKLWPELMEVPINPISLKTKLIRYFLSKTKLGSFRNKILKKIKD
ncbi:MAG: hypothetical protein ACX93O_08095 [Flagellimonas sp.]